MTLYHSPPLFTRLFPITALNGFNYHIKSLQWAVWADWKTGKFRICFCSELTLLDNFASKINSSEEVQRPDERIFRVDGRRQRACFILTIDADATAHVTVGHHVVRVLLTFSKLFPLRTTFMGVFANWNKVDNNRACKSKKNKREVNYLETWSVTNVGLLGSKV